MDDTDRMIFNDLQGGFPICANPFTETAEKFGITESELIERIQSMQGEGAISRFGPMYHAERMGGGLTLAAMSIPDDKFEQVAGQVNAMPEVAHNYAREHRLNMWFVLATVNPERIDEVITNIEQQTGYPVYNMPKLEEFFIGLKLEV